VSLGGREDLSPTFAVHAHAVKEQADRERRNTAELTALADKIFAAVGAARSVGLDPVAVLKGFLIELQDSAIAKDREESAKQLATSDRLRRENFKRQAHKLIDALSNEGQK
jgi:hypothetical protein